MSVILRVFQAQTKFHHKDMENIINIPISEKELSRLIRIFTENSEARTRQEAGKEYKTDQNRATKKRFLTSISDYAILAKLRKYKPTKPRKTKPSE